MCGSVCVVFLIIIIIIIIIITIIIIIIIIIIYQASFSLYTRWCRVGFEPYGGRA